jgi:YD repeat-containing protein
MTDMTRFKITVTILLMISFCTGYGQNQSFNANAEKSFININLPKTPESQGFETYGNINVSEVTGTPDISIPIYALQSKFLNTQIALSYNATGIRVNQEAGWAGLGFDLLAGGRITVDIKGNIDGVAQWNAYHYKIGIQKIFDRLGTSNAKAILTYATTQVEMADTETVFNSNFHYDDTKTVETMAWWGAGEPDIYHATFAGQSFSFYFDLVTDSIKFIGEKSLCSITPVRQEGHTNIIKWIVTDSKGINYYFDVSEETKFSEPTNYGLFATDENKNAWLLTKILHPAGDSILFTYNSYGETYPAFNWSASVGGRADDYVATSNSNDAFQNQFKQYPAYLTKIETSNTVVDFILSNRNDLRGPGAKKVDEIRISDKLTSEVKKKVQFRYSYFPGSSGAYTSTLPDSLKGYAQKRLKLDSLYLADSATGIPPYRFHYFLTDGPDKFSFSQDHWGYYNAANNTSVTYASTSPKNMIPKQSDLIAEKILPSAVVTGVTPPADGVAVSRRCDTFYMKTMSLDMITYPTGGKTVFAFEPHQSAYISPSYILTGGGLRVKRITNINSDGSIALATEYGYSGGVYMGSINYLTIQLSILSYSSVETVPNPVFITFNNMGNYGPVNDNDFLVGYSQVTKIDKNDFTQTTNGSVIKYFNIPQSYEVALNSSIENRQAAWPITYTMYGQTYLYNNEAGLLFINPYFYGLAPTPRKQLDGKLMKEEYKDNNNQLVKSIEYYYSQKDYSEKLYSIKAKDNYVGGLALGEYEPVMPYYGYNQTAGVRRYTMVVSPAKSFYTVTDSVIEKTYQGTNYITQKKAYAYNQYFQPEYETVYNSDGSQIISRTLTSLAFGKMINGIPTSSEITDLASLMSVHIYDLPVEQTQMRRTVSGDSLVVGSTFNLYRNFLPAKSYSLESSGPILFRSQFTPLSLSEPDQNHYTSLQMDSRYRLQDTAAYSTAKLVKDVYTKSGNRAYIWDEHYNTILVQCVNATNADIAYSSFETNNYGNWTLTPEGITGDNTSPTGTKAYSLDAGTVAKSGLNSTRSYIVSYWSKAGSKTVNSTTGTSGASFNGWTYYEHLVANPSGGTITISGSGLIDEVRLFPKGSLLNTYTYAPLVGLINQSDANNRISRFEYDGAGRLLRIRDEKRNIIRQFDYRYNNVFNFPYGNVEKVSTATKSGCATGYVGHVTYPYTVPPNKYGSLVSQSDADSKAQADVDQNGQIYANLHGTCIPYWNFASYGGWNIANSSFGLSGTGSVNFSIVVYGNYPSVYGQLGTLSGSLFLPSATRYVTVSSGGNSYTLTFYPSGQVNIAGSGFNGARQFNGSFTL